MRRCLSALLVPLVLAAAPALAQDSGQPGLSFLLRGGVATSPDYFGSEDYSTGFDLGISRPHLTLPNGKSLGNPDPWGERIGWGVKGAFRVVGAVDSEDSSKLKGLDDVDKAYEVGLGLRYGTENVFAYAETRRGFGGHEAWVGEAGLDLIAHPTDKWRLSAGPRLFFGSDDYADTYFGVSSSEAAKSAYSSYDANGGLLSAGLEVTARYQINNDWGVEGAVSWERFTGDAADSPIVEAGDADQWGVRLGVVRAVRLRF